MASRLQLRDAFYNEDPGYKEEIFQDKGVERVYQYETPTLRYPSAEEIQTLSIETELWKRGSKLFKLAHKHYSDSRMWWVIAWFNQKPTDSHYTFGDKVLIPKPLEVILNTFRN